MFVKYARNSHKEYDAFMTHIMNSRTSENVLYLYSTKKRKQEYITKIFMWIDKKYIKEIKMWGNSHSIYKIIIKNFCGQIMQIQFKKMKKIIKNSFEMDDLQEKLKTQHDFTAEDLSQFYENWKSRREENNALLLSQSN